MTSNARAQQVQADTEKRAHDLDLKYPSSTCVFEGVLVNLWQGFALTSLKTETNMLSRGFATEGVCVRGGPHVAKADNE